ncbi:MAG: S8 family serine peptidase [Eubacterium sp.]|nr:S8 family serine peptidase [Eubacterium sp.]
MIIISKLFAICIAIKYTEIKKGGPSMKKRIGIVLALSLLMSALYPCQTLISDEMNRKSVNLFCNAVAQLNEKYEFTEDDCEYHYNQNNPNATENRLIVKTRDNITDDTALERVSGLEYTILQYEDKQTMERSYDELRDKGYTVEKDKILSVKENTVKNLRTMANETATQAEEVADRWAYESVMSDYAKAEIEKSSAYNNEIVIGVLDSGVDYNLELFSGRITDTSFNMSASGSDNDCMDEDGHGTAVAGVIAMATPDNVKIKPYKLTAGGVLSLSEFIAAMEAILASKDLPDIMNISLGDYLFSKSCAFETELVSRLVDKGVTVCIAAGNDNLPVEYITPANCETAITVGAYDYTNYICSFSNYGKEIDVAAPGHNVYSIEFWTGDYNVDFGGTSAACPFASAACAYILMQNPNLSPAEVQEKLKASAIDMGEDERDYYGSGMVNFLNLLNDQEYAVPEPDIKGGFFTDTQTVSFDSIPDDSQLVYTLDKSLPSADNGTVYTQPITIDNEMQLNYALIRNGKYVSAISSQYYTIQYLADENDFEITEDGIITKYTGNKNNIVVPDVIKGIVPVHVKSVYQGKNGLTSVVLPDSVTTLSDYAFAFCSDLKYVTARGLKEIDADFYACVSLRFLDAPHLERLGKNAFKSCIMMHKVNFENSLKRLADSAFMNSGLLEINLSNLEVENQNGYRGVFYGSTLIKCSIPGVKIVGNEYFALCYFLQELNIPDAEYIGQYIVRKCNFLTKVDLSNLEEISYNAFSACYIDILYAPKLNKISGSTSSAKQGIAFQSYIRIVDLPSLTSAGRLLCSMFVKEVYLENLKTMDQNTFANLPILKVVYLPKVQTYYGTAVNKNEPEASPGQTDTFWIPRAQWNNPALTVGIISSRSLVFAPNTTKIDATCYLDSVVVLSEKATDVQIGYDGGKNGKFPTIIAPKGSAAQEFAELQNNNGYLFKYKDSDNVVNFIENDMFVCCNEQGERIFRVPARWIADLWNTDDINNTRGQSAYMFSLDVNNDNYINAKDYAQLSEYKNKSVRLCDYS